MNTSRRGIPFVFYLLIFLYGIPSFVFLNASFIQLSVFLGTHMASVATITVAMLSCFALGCRLFGKIADQTKYRFLLLFVLTGILSILIFMQPLLLRKMGGIFLDINRNYISGPVRIETLRFLFTFILFLFPGGIIAGITPILISQYIKNIGQTGLFLGASIIAGTLGASAGLILSSFYLIPVYGIRTTLYFSAFLFLIVAALILALILMKQWNIFQGNTQEMAHRAGKAMFRFKKKKAILEIYAKLTRALLRVLFIHGFTTVSFLIICIRILDAYRVIAPVYFHSILIVVFLFGLTIGGVLYKRISDRPANSYLTFATFQIMAGFGAALSYAALLIFTRFTEHQVIETFSFTTRVSKQGILFACLLFIPAFISGFSLPLTGKIYPRRLEKTGNSFGHIGYIWFMGALTGVIITPFFLIPMTGLYYAFFLIVLLTIMSGIYLILRDSRLIRGFRIGYALFGTIMFLLMVGIFNAANIKLPANTGNMHIEGSTASVDMTEQPDGSKNVTINGRLYFSTDNKELINQYFPALVPQLINTGIQSALVIGFGTGITASVLENSGVPMIAIIEPIPEIIRLSSVVFANENDDILTNSHVTITINDPRDFINRLNGTTDLITSGCEQVELLPSMYTLDFYQICYSKLSNTGTLCQILPATRQGSSVDLMSIIKSCTSVFPEVSLWYLSPENVLMVASKNSFQFEYCQLSNTIAEMNRGIVPDMAGYNDFETVLAHLLIDNKQLRNLVSSAAENSDNMPFVQYSRQDNFQNNKLLIPVSETVIDYASLIVYNTTCNVNKYAVEARIARINASFRRQLVSLPDHEQ